MKKLYFLMIAVFAVANVQAQVITIPDVNFKNVLLAASSSNSTAYNLTGAFKIDANSNNEIEVSEALEVRKLRIGGNLIVSLIGIEYFTNIEEFDFQSNLVTALNINNLVNLQRLNCMANQITALDVSQSPQLITLNCMTNQLATLNVNGLVNMTTLECYNNQLTNINVTGLTSLVTLNCGANNLTDLNVAGLTNLRTLNFKNNDITSISLPPLTSLLSLDCSLNAMPQINITMLSNLTTLYCTDNLLTNIDFSGTPKIAYLHCSNNPFIVLDVTALPLLNYLNCSYSNSLQSLLIKNGATENILFFDLPNLSYICADESQIASIVSNLPIFGITNCHVNSYCSFEPGGVSYRIQGDVRFDRDNNGCNTTDTNYPNLKFVFASNTFNEVLVSNNTGHYGYNLAAGNYTVTPQMENPNYFSISPTTVAVAFPAAASPFNQNFCIIPTGVNADLDVTVLPITIARPGFDVTYRIVLKNKGNQIQAGSLQFNYQDAVLDFVSANPSISLQSPNSLVFDFDELQPFESKIIRVTFNVNSMVENPAVNGGDILDYTATVVSSADETPDDNIFTLHQTVVNSFDPNDKTCLEGATITPEMVGKYVHYMIRFENTGTASAENIVVKDMIDTAKFDVSSLIPLDGSHEFVTRINGNKVEFIFENIDLPFDNANNDGYVAFKIKTKPTLVLGDTFSNTASIYFDYNFPIVTEPSVTAIAVLAKRDFEFDSYFRIYPNPADEVLKIESKQNIEVQSISIYNTLGQLVLVVPNATTTKVVDVSGLHAGNYFVKFATHKGSTHTKFIKR